MLNNDRIKNLFKNELDAYAHCDIPCGIYDPKDAIQAAQTVVRMTELLEELDFSSIYPEESFQDEGEDIEVLRERLKTEINKNKELNDGLVDSINNLNNKVADLNNTNRGTQLQKTGSILSIPIIGGALKSGGRLARKISKWFGG